MKRFFSRCPWLLVVLFLASACGAGPATTRPATSTPAVTAPPTGTAPPTVTAPPLPSPAPSPTPSTVPTAEPLPTGPPVGASPGQTWRRPADGTTMVYVPAGEFEMGSNDPYYNNEHPPHRVGLDAFWLDQTEVTNGQYQACEQAGACKPPDSESSFTRSLYYDQEAYEEFPVVHVNWYRAVAYCQWVGGRLPTEEEWEYAARGPESRWFPWGDAPDPARLNYCDARCPLPHADPSGDDGYADTAPVGSYPAGASWCGALDLVGNVWEWVWDWYGFYPAEENPDWLAPEMQNRVIRGGAWDTNADHARCTFRNWYNPTESHDSIGFRCAVSPQEP